MASLASLRLFPTCTTLAALAVLGGCGNRGELYLEPVVDEAAEAEIRRLGTDLPDGGVVDPLVTPRPGPGPAGVPGTAPDGAADEADDADEEDDAERQGDDGAAGS